MKLIEPKVEKISQESLLEGIYKQIEIAGRTCYKSSPGKSSADDFVNRMIKSKHMSMLEHGTVYLTIPIKIDNYRDRLYMFYTYRDNKYSKANKDEDYIYVTTNYRVLVENGWSKDLTYLCEPTEFHYKRTTLRFTTQVAISREFNRHRVHSPAEQSTSYCNYSKDRFGGEITVNTPSFIDPVDCHFGENYTLLDYCTHIASHSKLEDGVAYFTAVDYWWFANLATEYSYMQMIKCGMSPKQARVVLPLDLNTELIHTAYDDDWKRFIEMRYEGSTGTPHPDAKYLTEKILQYF